MKKTLLVEAQLFNGLMSLSHAACSSSPLGEEDNHSLVCLL